MSTVTTILAYLVLVVAVAFVAALPVMWLWDWLMPTIFGLPEITWAQSLGLMLLCHALFKSNVEVKK